MERQRNVVMSNTQLVKDHSSITSASGGTNNSTRSYKASKDIPPSWNYNTTTTASSGGGGDHHPHQQDYLTGGFSWPPRSYTCSFCKREFRSAQALGGHMNVHRRDRARLRQSPPLPPPPPTLDNHHNILNLNLNLNNPNPNPRSTTTMNSNFSSSATPSHQLVSSPCPVSVPVIVGRRPWAPIEGRVLDHHDPLGRVVIPQDHLSKVVGTRKSLFGGGGREYSSSSSSSSSWFDHRGLTMGQQRDGANKFRKRGGDRFTNNNNVHNVSLELEIGVITESKNHHHHHHEQQQQLDLELRLGI